MLLPRLSPRTADTLTWLGFALMLGAAMLYAWRS
jgi:hypothetical protein